MLHLSGPVMATPAVLDRFAAWRIARKDRGVAVFRTGPVPRSIGSPERGRQLCAGQFLLGGHLVDHPGAAPWTIAAPNRAFAAELHGFGWMDDLAALGDGAARQRMRAWSAAWVTRFGRGRGPGWSADLTGRRVLRLLHHGAVLDDPALRRSLLQQVLFLAARWHRAPAGLPRLEALAALLHGAASLEGLEHLSGPASEALARACRGAGWPKGDLASRNPEELLEIFTHLIWSVESLSQLGLAAPAPVQTAITAQAGVLRGLRHPDGGLPRFHGGGRGSLGWLDQALAMARGRRQLPEGLCLGFARLSGGRSTVIVDAAPPQAGNEALQSHASTLGFELTSGRRPVVVNCGSGVAFGAKWRRAGRATASHSVLSLRGVSSAHLGEESRKTGREALMSAPVYVPIEQGETSDGLRFQGGHDGFLHTHGLTHARTLELRRDGSALIGEDMLLAMEDVEKQQFEAELAATQRGGIDFDIRFHLHPDVEVVTAQDGAYLALRLRSGEIWEFHHDGSLALDLAGSVYLEADRLEPRPTKQIVLSGRAVAYATRVRWSLSKTPETATGLRDLAQDAPMLPGQPITDL